MTRRVKLLALALALLAAAANTRADIANPDKGKNKNSKTSAVATTLRLAPDDDAKEAKLVIPRDVWQQMKAGLDGGDSQTAASVTSAFNANGLQTAVAGFFMSLAFAFGGVWLVRLRKTSARLGPAALSIVALALCGAAAGAAYANAGPPPVARSLTSKILIDDLQWWGATGQVKVEVSDDARMITLVLPRQKK